MYHFCTYFDKNYLVRGLALYRSLQRHCDRFSLFVLCLDDETFSLLSKLNLNFLRLISLRELESNEKDLLPAKINRSDVEYFFTLSPVLPRYLLRRFSDIDVITYLDADLFFFASPDPIYDEFSQASVLVIEHRFPKDLQYRLERGRFNVQYLSFRNNDQGIACLNRWRSQCLSWCYDRVENGKYADQKYLDEWPSLYDQTVVLEHKGAGMGPWNWRTHPIEIRGDKIFIDGDELIFYHFHGVRILTQGLVSIGMYRYGQMPRELQDRLYRVYVREMKETARWIENTLHLPVSTPDSNKRTSKSLLYELGVALLSRQLLRIR